MNVIALVQARMGSKRLPGKVMKQLNEKPMIALLLKRLSNSKLINSIILITSKESENDILVNYIKKLGFNCFRGEERDVLDRYYKAARAHGGDLIVRITADCPLIDPRLVDEVVSLALNRKKDYCSNIIPRSFPNGQDVEVISFSALEKCWKEASEIFDREHVTTYIRKNSSFYNKNGFQLINYISEKNLSCVRMTVDENEDFECIKLLIEKLGEEADWVSYTNFILNNHEFFKNQNI